MNQGINTISSDKNVAGGNTAYKTIMDYANTPTDQAQEDNKFTLNVKKLFLDA